MSVLVNDNDIGNEVWAFIRVMTGKVIFLAETRDFDMSSK
jgi:hypothetical protein